MPLRCSSKRRGPAANGGVWGRVRRHTPPRGCTPVRNGTATAVARRLALHPRLCLPACEQAGGRGGGGRRSWGQWEVVELRQLSLGAWCCARACARLPVNGGGGPKGKGKEVEKGRLPNLDHLNLARLIFASPLLPNATASFYKGLPHLPDR